MNFVNWRQLARVMRAMEWLAAGKPVGWIALSCGYSSVRKTLTVDEIGEIFSAVKRVKPDIICFVDNCYGEFIEDKEPTQVGADLMAGSLIKNLGGGIAPTGGYIVGRKDLVELAS